jgi:hypothetical protein
MKGFGVNAGLALGRLSLLRKNNRYRMRWRKGLFGTYQSCALNVQLRNKRMFSVPRLNLSANTDTQQQVAAARQLLRAGGLQRYTLP